MPKTEETPFGSNVAVLLENIVLGEKTKKRHHSEGLGIHIYMDVSKNRGGPPKSSILIGFGTIIITIHFGGFRPIFGNTHMYFFLRCFRDWDPYHI